MRLFSFLSRKKKKKEARLSAPSARTRAGLQPIQKPDKHHARKHLKRITRALTASQSRYATFLAEVAESNVLETDKKTQDALIAFVDENRQLVDSLEICLILLLSDHYRVDLRKPLRPFLRRALEDLQKAEE